MFILLLLLRVFDRLSIARGRRTADYETTHRTHTSEESRFFIRCAAKGDGARILTYTYVTCVT